jgi:hypothetical protein
MVYQPDWVVDVDDTGAKEDEFTGTFDDTEDNTEDTGSDSDIGYGNED